MERQSRVRLIRQGISPIKILRRLLDSDLMAFEKQWVCPECDGHGRHPPEKMEGFGGPYYCFPCKNKGWMTRKEKHKYENPTPYWENMLIPRKEKQELKQKFEAENAKEKARTEKSKKRRIKQIGTRTTKSRLTNDLESLEAMLERGSLTEAEFKIAKQEILRKSEVERDPKTDRRKSKSKKQVIKNKHESIDEELLKIGDLVKHPSFGKGVVVNICGSGMSVEATIEFANHGKKHLAVAWAPLKKVK